MDTGAIMEQQMQDQIEAGIAMRDAFDSWFIELVDEASHGYGTAIQPTDQYGYFTYFKRGWSPSETARDCFSSMTVSPEEELANVIEEEVVARASETPAAQ